MSWVETGMGVRVDINTGRTMYNPGMSSQVFLNKGTCEDYMHQHSDVETRFPIPNEREIRTTMRMSGSSSNIGTRKVQVQGDGHTSFEPTDLPFNPPTLIWKGAPTMTTSWLLAHRDNILIASTSRKKINTIRGRG